MNPPEDRPDPGAEAPPAPESVEPAGDETAVTASDEVAAKQETPSQEEADYLEQLQRLQAEFSNYRRRIQRERAQWEMRAKGDLLAGLLPILDDLDRARASLSEDKKSKHAEGLLLILSRLEESLRSVGLEVQPVEPGTPFNPDIHEAMLTEPSEDHAEGMILGTLQPGYVYQDLLLRPARVRVSSGPAEEPSKDENQGSGR